ncbi:phage tail tube protein [Streptomyces turgidiscabies]|uniref:phage tail tube protein n=1 Tax=Streptomyces turgidiscabies TaxID=85558 RepID=UPI0038F6E2D0
MATSDPYIGRREAIGIGIEATPGTAVAPQTWLRWLDQNLQNKANVVENESALGVVDRVEDSAVSYTWAEGSIGGKITVDSMGFLLLGFFGSVSTGAAVSGVYPHTFTMDQSSLPKTLTFARSSPLASQRFAYGVVDSLEITAETDQYVQVVAAVKARAGASSSETVALTTQEEFLSKHVTLKVAANTAGLAAATKIDASRVQVVLERTSEVFNPLGSDNAPVFDRGVYEARGEFVVRMTDTQYETDFLAGTRKALSIDITSNAKGVNFVGSKVRYRELESNRDRDGIVTATVQFFFEFDTAVNTALATILKSTLATYASV